jgi:hypothetical protein
MRERVVPNRPRKLGRIAPRRLPATLTRSEMMGRVWSKDTKPEETAGFAAHTLGDETTVRFRFLLEARP